MFFFSLTLLVFALDQLIKHVVNISMRANQSIPIISNVLHLTYVQNRGAAFGLFWGSTWFLIVVDVLAICAIIYFRDYFGRNIRYKIALAFILGGSLGNTFDRVFRHFVVDYIDFRVWPVFNLADIAINTGVFLLIVFMLFDKKEGS